MIRTGFLICLLTPFLVVKAFGQSILWSYTGSTPGQYAGVVVAGGGDLNGDNVPDVAFNKSFSVPNQVTVVSIRHGLSGSEMYVLQGEAIADSFGFAIDILPDVSGDGLDDVVIGAPGSENTHFNTFGYVKMFRGIDGLQIWKKSSQYKSTLYGYSAKYVGDVNLDGSPDIVFGEPTFSSRISHGAVHILSGVNGNYLKGIPGPATGGALGYFGKRVTGIGMLNADLVPDILVLGDGSGSYLQVFSGAVGSPITPIRTECFISGTFPYCSSTTITQAGQVLNLGDLDSDHFNEYAISSPFGSVGIGFVNVYSGLTGMIVDTLTDNTMGSHFGVSLDSVGDIDDDGVSDFCIGASGNSLIKGKVYCYSGQERTPLYTFESDVFGDSFGVAISGAGDVNGDDEPDLVVGSPHYSVGGTNVGRVQLFAGPPLVGATENVCHFMPVGTGISACL